MVESAHPLEVASLWGRAIATGDVDGALASYAPDARLWIKGDALTGRRHIRMFLESLDVLGCNREPTVRAGDETVFVLWGPRARKELGLEAECRVTEGLIAEQAIGRPAELRTPPVETQAGDDSINVVVLHGGEVPAGAADYGRHRLSLLTRRVKEPLLFVQLKLASAPDPARSRPALAEATLDVNGDVIRAHVAAREITEAIDLVERRLADKLEHRAAHRLARRRPHGALPAATLEYEERD